MYDIGRICIKLAGRDAGRECVIVDVLEKKFVLIDGNVRRRKCNITHLEPTSKTVDIKKNADHTEVSTAFKKIKLPVWNTKPKQTEKRPRKVRKVKEAPKPKKEKVEKKAQPKDKKAPVKAKPAPKAAPSAPKKKVKKKTVKKAE